MRAQGPVKSASAFRTISEVSAELDVPQHVLRFWETRFPQIRPLKRGGGRRYYRPEDVELLRRIQSLLYKEGYTIRGVQRLLRESRGAPHPEPAYRPEPVEPDAACPDVVHPDAVEAPDMPQEDGADLDPEPLELPPDVRRELVTVLDELRAIRALLGRDR
ncbi:MerR family transcriptional regulator [Azospirillum sp. RWY-5-1]|uniref:MerR family transcriptional regulator n=1 Tax=Azospirillum oleiclasticum TaxID=2735135 RepID=A0ABX2TCI4_9PROT|nr:MerR family transcriptional regulator [Azospirillum oleiclasticum]NYZ15779.1 MerR family transcriptional regulator [Azospirillum oleiclasticum]NYZ22049.1 MerR family transcriptional regulator [Azospirillum oleiclasticum]